MKTISIALFVGLLVVAWLGASACLVSFSPHGACGDGQLDPEEECDEGEANSDTAPDACRTDCTRARCGDGVVDVLEDCDGSNLDGETCESVSPGLVGGVLACDDRCRFELGGCTGCPNGYVEPGESCDGTNFGAETCETITGLAHGSLVCSAGCTLDASGCHECGNGAIEGPELCEPGDVGGLGCADVGNWNGGELACGEGCVSWDDSGCFQCGDGLCEPGRGEDLLTCPADCECVPDDEAECPCPGWEVGIRRCGADYRWPACPCPACTAATHDEDADGLADGCENCPDVGNDTQANDDSDQLGDACEAAGNHALLGEGVHFESFELAPTLPGWNLDAHMTGSADVLLGDTSSCGADCRSNAVWQQNLDGVYGVSIRWFHDGPGDGFTCLLVGYESWKPWVTCCVERFTSGPSALQLWRFSVPSTLTKMTEVQGVDTASADTVRRLFAVWDGTGFTCHFSNSAGQTSQVSSTSVQAVWTEGRAGIRVYEERATFLSFSVVR